MREWSLCSVEFALFRFDRWGGGSIIQYSVVLSAVDSGVVFHVECLLYQSWGMVYCGGVAGML